jgi:hypothetical protein
MPSMTHRREVKAPKPGHPEYFDCINDNKNQQNIPTEKKMNVLPDHLVTFLDAFSQMHNGISLLS